MGFWDTQLGRLLAGPQQQTAQVIQDVPQALQAYQDPNAGLEDEDRRRQMAIIAQLQQQAMYGDPVALAQLQMATQTTVAGQSALGQSVAAQHGTDASTAMRNILGGQAHAQQVGVGQADVAKALERQQAQQQLAGLMGGVRAQDIGQAAQKQSQQAGLNAAQTAYGVQGDQQAQKIIGAAGQTITSMAAASDGGKVGGAALVPGDDGANDIVPAMLSPGEIVIPRSHAGSPEAAAAFVAALQHQKAQHFADGGGVRIAGQADTGANAAQPEDVGLRIAHMLGVGPARQVPFTQLDTGPANGIRTQQGALVDQLSAQAQGGGPSAVGGQLQAATDQNLQGAMAASARGQNPLGVAAERQQELAGESAMARAGEVSDAQRLGGQVAGQMRGQSLQQREIIQKQALAETLANMGLDAAHINAIINQVGAAGQGLAVAGSSGIFAKSGSETTPEQLSALSSQPYPEQQGSSPSDWSDPYSEPGRGSASDISNGDGKAHGGVIKDPHFATGRGADGKPFRFACGGMAPETVARFSGGGIARDLAWEASQAEMWRRKRADDAGAAARQASLDAEAPPIARDPEWEKRQAAAWAAEHQVSSRVADARPQPRPASATPRHLAEGGFVTIKGSDGKPMRVARSGVSPAFLQRFAEGGPVLSSEQQDALTSHLTGPQSPLASFQPALPRGAFAIAARPPLAPPVVDYTGGHMTGPAPMSIADATAANVAKYNAWQQTPAGMAKRRLELVEAGKGSGPGGKYTPEEVSLMNRADLPANAPDYGEAPPAPTPEARTTKRTPPGGVTGMERAPAPAPRSAGPSGYSAPSPVDTQQGAMDAIERARHESVAEQGRLEQDQATQKADVLKSDMAAQADADAQATKLNADYQAHRQAAQDKYRTMVDKYAGAEVDPSRFWANKTTGDKILAGIGLALGALGGSSTGVNASVAIINQAIDRDIEAQKESISRQGEAAGRQGQLLGIMRADFGDDAQALAAAKSAGLQRTQNRIQEMMTRTRGPIEKARLAQLDQAISAQRAEKDREFAATQDARSKAHAVELAKLGLMQQAAGAKGVGKVEAQAVMTAKAKTALNRYIEAGAIGNSVELDEAANTIAAARGKVSPKLVKMYREQLTHLGALTGSGREKAANAFRRQLDLPVLAAPAGDFESEGGEG